jgi:secondary thiamine-phosphate synthase enzyme
LNFIEWRKEMKGEWIEIKTRSRVEFKDITQLVCDKVRKSEISSGILLIYCPHTTAALTINESADPAVVKDITQTLEELVPSKGKYYHLEGNADSHIKSHLTGPSLCLAIEEKNVILGTWQGIFFCEFDGPRHRRIFLKMIQG